MSMDNAMKRVVTPVHIGKSLSMTGLGREKKRHTAWSGILPEHAIVMSRREQLGHAPEMKKGPETEIEKGTATEIEKGPAADKDLAPARETLPAAKVVFVNAGPALEGEALALFSRMLESIGLRASEVPVREPGAIRSEFSRVEVVV